MAFPTRVIQLLLLLYCLASVSYTSRRVLQWLLDGASNTGIAIFSLSPSKSAYPQASHRSNLSNHDALSSDLPGFLSSLISTPTETAFHWRSSNNHAGDLGLVSIKGDDDVSLLEETLLSKAFSQSLHPTRIIPFFYKATTIVEQEDVTITTLVTSNRFKVLKQLVERYQGPMSVTIHVLLPTDVPPGGFSKTHPSVTALRELHELYNSSPYFSTYVDVHLALSPFSRTVAKSSNPTARGNGEGEGGRQFNVWRNVARLFARSEFVMMLDVDFAVCTDWRNAIRDSMRRIYGTHTTLDILPAGPKLNLLANQTSTDQLMLDLKNGLAALVVPAFEYLNQEAGKDQSRFPQDKESLVRLVKSIPPVISSFHPTWLPGHNSTDYPRFYSIPPGSGEVYKVTQYQSAYEPYVITGKRVPWCDERFTGYGGNKAACLFEMYLSGVSFYVLADHFLIHQSHKYEEEARREERKYNRKLYTDFKEETCLRYLHRFHRAGTLNSSIASNAMDECKKIKSVAKLVPELLGRS